MSPHIAAYGANCYEGRNLAPTVSIGLYLCAIGSGQCVSWGRNPRSGLKMVREWMRDLMVLLLRFGSWVRLFAIQLSILRMECWDRALFWSAAFFLIRFIFNLKTLWETGRRKVYFLSCYCSGVSYCCGFHLSSIGFLWTCLKKLYKLITGRWL